MHAHTYNTWERFTLSFKSLFFLTLSSSDFNFVIFEKNMCNIYVVLKKNGKTKSHELYHPT